MLEYFKKMNPLALAIVIDVAMLLPWIDVVICIPLQHILWGKNKLDNPMLEYINHAYSFADFVIPIVGDILPLNTICVLLFARDKAFGGN
jgi:hypothetical protein